MSGSAKWKMIALTSDPEELREHIFTGYRTGKPFVPYIPTVHLSTSFSLVLDFGCGVGRNFPYLKSIAKQVIGFDLEPMIARCRALATERIDLLTSDWGELSLRRFDLIFAALVLQHLEADTCRAYLSDFAEIAPTIYLLTRLQSDFGVNVLGLIAESGLFEVADCTMVEHDPGNHELLMLERCSFAEAARAVNNLHYEVVLMSRTFVR